MLINRIDGNETIELIPPQFVNYYIPDDDFYKLIFKKHNINPIIPSTPKQMSMLYQQWPGVAELHSTYLLVKKLTKKFAAEEVYPDFFKNGGTLDWD